MPPVAFRVLMVLGLMFLFTACAPKAPASNTQWWRIGNCLVLYEGTGMERQIIAVGQGCEIKREMVTGQGAAALAPLLE
jgi:hypothetical protein